MFDVDEQSDLEEAEPFAHSISLDSISQPDDAAHASTPRLEPSVVDHGNSRTDSKIKKWLYISHFLSTWNSRAFEFGAVLFLAEIFPDTLLPVSIYALLRAFSAICFSPVVGSTIDSTDRLALVRASIVGQRASVVISCLILGLLTTEFVRHTSLKSILLIVVYLLACIEKLCSVVNLIAIERDWVVIISENTPLRLRDLNSQMRRIDLACKVLGPLAIALLDGLSIQIAIVAMLAMNVMSVPIEYYTIAKV